MIAVGERSGEMEEMLRRIGQIYDGEVDRVITRFTSLLEPVMIVVMGVIVLFIVVAILLPISKWGRWYGKEFQSKEDIWCVHRHKWSGLALQVCDQLGASPSSRSWW